MYVEFHTMLKTQVQTFSKLTFTSRRHIQNKGLLLFLFVSLSLYFLSSFLPCCAGLYPELCIYQARIPPNSSPGIDIFKKCLPVMTIEHTSSAVSTARLPLVMSQYLRKMWRNIRMPSRTVAVLQSDMTFHQLHYLPIPSSSCLFSESICSVSP